MVDGVPTVLRIHMDDRLQGTSTEKGRGLSTVTTSILLIQTRTARGTRASPVSATVSRIPGRARNTASRRQPEDSDGELTDLLHNRLPQHPDDRELLPLIQAGRVDSSWSPIAAA